MVAFVCLFLVFDSSILLFVCFLKGSVLFNFFGHSILCYE